MAGIANVQDVFLIFGDSITEVSFQPEHKGIGQRLAHDYARRLDIVNRGLSGYNTDWGLPVLKQCVAKKADAEPAPEIRVITIWFGANDACIRPSPQHVPLDAFVANLRQMISIVRGADTSGGTRIVLITPPPVNTYQRAAVLAARSPPEACDREFLVTKQYAEAVLAVAASEHVAAVDIWNPMYNAAKGDERQLDRFLHDGLHLNEAGYHLVYERLIDTIQKCYPDVHYEHIPYTFPRWDEINWNSPEESFGGPHAE